MFGASLIVRLSVVNSSGLIVASFKSIAFAFDPAGAAAQPSLALWDAGINSGLTRNNSPMSLARLMTAGSGRSTVVVTVPSDRVTW